MQALKRFAKYSVIGGGTFLLDLSLLYVFTDFWGINYIVGAGLAFLIAVSINYTLSRTFVFKGTKRGMKAGYINFLFIVGVGLLAVMGGMYVLVTLLGLGYLVSRVVVAVVTGFWNYLINLFVNFKVVGKH